MRLPIRACSVFHESVLVTTVWCSALQCVSVPEGFINVSKPCVSLELLPPCSPPSPPTRFPSPPAPASSTVVGELPVPHHGISLSVADFRLLLARLTEHRVTLSKAPHVVDKNTPLEQHMTWLKDPSGNNLVFNAFVKPANMFSTTKPVFSGQTQQTLTMAMRERASAAVAVPMTSSAPVVAEVESAAESMQTAYIATAIIQQQQQQQQQL